jgi:hypothetical protein
VALIRQDHRYNHPVSLVFFDVMRAHLSRFRQSEARRKVRKNLRLIYHFTVVQSALRTGKPNAHSLRTAAGLKAPSAPLQGQRPVRPPGGSKGSGRPSCAPRNTGARATPHPS